jgi:non-homologous end joining protein Ku
VQELKTATRAGITLSLDFLNVVVSVFAAVGEDTSAKLTTLCTHLNTPLQKDHKPNPIKQKYVCPTCESEDKAAFVKGRKAGSDYVILKEDVQEQVKAAAKESADTIALTVHPADQVTGVLMPSGKSYYLGVKGDSDKATAKLSQTYTLLSRLVSEHPEWAFMGKFTLSSATSIFQLTVAGEGTLVLRQMADANLVRVHPNIEWIEPTERALEVAAMIAEDAIVPFVESTHGTGKTNIIAAYVEANAPAATTPGAGSPLGGLDMEADLEARLLAARAAKLAAAAPVDAPVKVSGRRAARVSA